MTQSRKPAHAAPNGGRPANGTPPAPGKPVKPEGAEKAVNTAEGRASAKDAPQAKPEASTASPGAPSAASATPKAPAASSGNPPVGSVKPVVPGGSAGSKQGEKPSGARNGTTPRLFRPLLNVLRLFTDDVRRLGGNVITALIVLGLVVLPSIFSWYNILACWDVFDNTGNLTVAVANVDKGYKSDLVPLEVNVGDRVEAALRENDQLNWVFTTEDDAVDGVRAGRYYAAVVIPESFSVDMMSFYSEDAEHAKITYYSNQKKSAIAPKVTDQGADRVSTQINETFAKTLSEVALGMASSLADYADKADVNSTVAKLADHVASLSSSLSESASVISMYSGTLDSARKLIEDSGELLGNASAAAGEVTADVGEAKRTVGSVESALKESAQALSDALGSSSESFAGVPQAVDAAFDSTSAVASDSASLLRNEAAKAANQASDLSDIKAKVEEIASVLPSEASGAADGLLRKLQAAIDLQERVNSTLTSAATSIESADADVQNGRAEAKSLAQKASGSLKDAKADYEANLKPILNDLASSLAQAGESVSSASGAISGSVGALTGDASTLSGRLSTAKGKLDAASQSLQESASGLSKLSDSIMSALATDDMQALRDIIGSDPGVLSAALSAPVQMDRIAVYPVENFGSAMAPLYTTLALWIGSLLIMVTLMVTPSQRQIRKLDQPTPRQLFFGRFGVVSIISLMQSTLLALGNMFFLGVQVNEQFLYLICFWVSGLVFAFIIYALVSMFANLGKALGVLLLIVQVSGGGGSFPLKLLPQFFQDVSPFLPITHAVNAMRAAMFGVYSGDFWHEIGILVMFAVPLLVAVLLFQGLLSKVVPRFVELVERSKLI